MSDNEESGEHSGNAEADPSCGPVEQSVAKPGNPSNDTSNRQNEPRQRSEDNAHAKARRFKAIWQIIVPTIVSILTLVVIVIQSIILQRQVSLSRLDQRAWVAPVEVTTVGELQIGEPLDTKIIFKNAGKTFAKKVEIIIFGDGFPADEPHNLCQVIDDWRSRDQGTVGVMSPNAEYHSRHKSDILTKEHVANLRSGKMVYHVYGRVTYEDVFGCAHWTKFASSLNLSTSMYEADHDCNEADNSTCP